MTVTDPSTPTSISDDEVSLGVPAEPTPDERQAQLDALVKGAVDLVNSGSVSMATLLKALSPKQESADAPIVLPTPRSITDKQRDCMARVPTVYGVVVPDTRRALQPVEIKALVEEKQVLDEVKKMAEARLADITVAVHNHLDVQVEEGFPEDGTVPDGLLMDDKGHWIVPGRAGVPDVEQEFSRETREQSPSLDAKRLETLQMDGVLDRKDYLAMTTPVRVVDEHKVLQVLKKRPSLVHVIRQATVPGKKGTSMFLRKRA